MRRLQLPRKFTPPLVEREHLDKRRSLSSNNFSGVCEVFSWVSRLYVSGKTLPNCISKWMIKVRCDIHLLHSRPHYRLGL